MWKEWQKLYKNKIHAIYKFKIIQYLFSFRYYLSCRNIKYRFLWSSEKCFHTYLSSMNCVFESTSAFVITFGWWLKYPCFVSMNLRLPWWMFNWINLNTKYINKLTSILSIDWKLCHLEKQKPITHLRGIKVNNTPSIDHTCWWWPWESKQIPYLFREKSWNCLTIINVFSLIFFFFFLHKQFYVFNIKSFKNILQINK